MLVLITGATGFIGRHLTSALLCAGHDVVAVARRPAALSAHARMRYLSVDFAQALDPADWLPRLKGVDAVINAVGILRERGTQTFEALHTRAPQALFNACAQVGVRRVIQISALGADADATSRYHLSKRAADHYLAGTDLDWIIVQPSLIYGSDGTSAQLFGMLACLPVIPLPDAGAQCVQPILIDDAVAAIANSLVTDKVRRYLALVGPEPLTFKTFLSTLRAGMKLRSARFLPIPMPLIRAAAMLAARLPGSLMDRETLSMLERGNVADAEPARQLLAAPLHPASEFIPATQARCVRQQAQLSWLLPLLRWSIALVWIFTGIVSFGAYPVSDSYALLARVGATGNFASLLLYGAAALDLAVGLGILLLRNRQWLWTAQLLLIAGYTIIITFKLPEFWLHPYGPVLKNLPLLAAIVLLQQLERNR